jgi:hypothetical protein
MRARRKRSTYRPVQLELIHLGVLTRPQEWQGPRVPQPAAPRNTIPLIDYKMAAAGDTD